MLLLKLPTDWDQTWLRCYGTPLSGESLRGVRMMGGSQKTHLFNNSYVVKLALSVKCVLWAWQGKPRELTRADSKSF